MNFREKLPTLGNKSKAEQLLNHGQNLLNNIEDRLLDITILEARLAKQGIKINLDDYPAYRNMVSNDGEAKKLFNQIEEELKIAQTDPVTNAEILKKFDENGEYHRKLKNLEKALLNVIHNYPFNQVNISLGDLQQEKKS